jgi:uncharacterized protein (TIGR02996 family)
MTVPAGGRIRYNTGVPPAGAFAMPTAAEESAFLAPILAAHRDDGPRLIYADFLADSDDPADRHRAEFVRLQLALARLPDDHPRRRELKHRADDLLHRFLPAWTAHLRGLATGFTFHRGLLDTVSVDVPTFVARGEEMFRRAPVRGVKFLDAARHVETLADCELLGRVRGLGLCGADLGNGGLNVLLRSPHLTGVESLDLSFNGLDDNAARLLGRTSALPRLRELRLNDNARLTSVGLTALAESPGLGGLELLDVSANDIGPPGIEAVVASPYLGDLHTFVAHSNPLGDGGVAALAGSELLARMLAREPKLALPRSGIGPDGARALAKSPVLAAVRELDLTGNQLADDGTRAVAESDHLPNLRRLVLMHNRVGDIGARALAFSPVMAGLDFLDVSSNRITRRGIDALWSARKDFQTVLEYGDNYLTPDPEELLRELLGDVPLRVILDALPRGPRPTGS